MTLKELEKHGYIILSHTDKEKRVGRQHVRPQVALPVGDNATTIELSDLGKEKKEAHCENCVENVTLKSKGFAKTPRKIADIVDGKPMNLIIYKHRWCCPLCGASLNTANDPYADSNKFDEETGAAKKKTKRSTSEEFDRYIIKTIMNDPRAKNNAFMEFGVSEQYVRKLISKYIEDNEQKIESVYPCSQIVFYPFMYRDRKTSQVHKHCCIFGLKPTEGYEKEKIVLLYIEEQYHIKALKEFVDDKVIQPNQSENDEYLPESIHCDWNPVVYKALREEYYDIYIAIIKRLVRATLEAYKSTEKECIKNDTMNLIRKLLIKIGDENRWPLHMKKILDEWWEETEKYIKEELDEERKKIKKMAQDNLKPIRECLISVVDGMDSGAKPFENNENIDICLELIEGFQKRRTSYDIMRNRMMFSPYAMHDELFAEQSMRLVWCDSPNYTLQKYYVDIEKLQEIYGEYCTDLDPDNVGMVDDAEFFTQEYIEEKLRHQINVEALLNPSDDDFGGDPYFLNQPPAGGFGVEHNRKIK